MRLTTSQNALHFGMKCSKLRRFLGPRPRPPWGAYDAPPTPQSGGDSCLQQSQLRAFSAYNFPDSHVYMRNTLKFRPAQSPPPWRLQRLDFFASNMSHYFKSLKISPAASCTCSVRIAGGVGGFDPPYLILPTPLPLVKIRPRGGRVSTPPPKFC